MAAISDGYGETRAIGVTRRARTLYAQCLLLQQPRLYPRTAYQKLRSQISRALFGKITTFQIPL